jgi:hypothetical protein
MTPPTELEKERVSQGQTDSGSTSKEKRRRPGSIIGKVELAVFAVYAVLVAFMTWPAVTLVSRVYAQRGDPLGAIWECWWYKYSFAKHLPVNLVSMVAVPFGLRQNFYFQDPLSSLTLRGFSIISTDTIAYNVFPLLCFFFTAVGMYYLARRLTGSRPAAAVAGLAFAFSPYMLVQGKEHLGLLTIVWLPVFFYFLLRAWKERSARMYVFCGLAFAVMTLFNYQYGLIGASTAIVFVVSVWLLGKPWRTKRRPNIMRSSAIVLVVLAVAAGLVVFALARRQWQARSLFSLYLYSGRPWDFLIPHADARILGGVTNGFILSHLHGGFISESSLFLGYLPMALGVYGVYATARRRRREKAAALEDPGEESGDEATADQLEGGLSSDTRIPYALVITAAACFLLSMPPTTTLLGIKIYLPSYFIHMLLPQVRAYARFGIAVMFCVALLAAYGVARLLEHRGFAKRKLLITLAISLVILLEFTIVPPFRSLDTATAADYSRWLEAKPGKPVIAIYPYFYGDDFQTYGYYFEQRHHEKPMVNGSPAGTQGEKVRQIVLSITNPSTPGVLQRLGTRYVVVIPSQYIPGNHMNYVEPATFNPVLVPPTLKKVAQFDDAIIYEDLAPPAEFMTYWESGAYQGIVYPDGRAWHPGAREMEIDIDADIKSPTTCDVAFEAAATKTPGTIRFSLNGVSSDRSELPTWPADFQIKDVVLKPGSNRLRITSDAALSAVTEVPPITTVQAAVMVSDLTITKKP